MDHHRPSLPGAEREVGLLHQQTPAFAAAVNEERTGAGGAENSVALAVENPAGAAKAGASYLSCLAGGGSVQVAPGLKWFAAARRPAYAVFEFAVRASVDSQASITRAWRDRRIEPAVPPDHRHRDLWLSARSRPVQARGRPVPFPRVRCLERSCLCAAIATASGGALPCRRSGLLTLRASWPGQRHVSPAVCRSSRSWSLAAQHDVGRLGRLAMLSLLTEDDGAAADPAGPLLSQQRTVWCCSWIWRRLAVARIRVSAWVPDPVGPCVTARGYISLSASLNMSRGRFLAEASWPMRAWC